MMTQVLFGLCKINFRAMSIIWIVLKSKTRTMNTIWFLQTKVRCLLPVQQAVDSFFQKPDFFYFSSVGRRRAKSARFLAFSYAAQFAFSICGLKQNAKSLLTPVSDTVFHALSHGSLHFFSMVALLLAAYFKDSY